MNITEIIPNFAQLISLAILAIGILAFTVSIITQVIKEVGVFAKIPTNIIVVVLAIVLTVGAFVATMQYLHITILWYMVVASIILGFFVAFIAMKGWKEFTDTLARYYYKEDFEDLF